MSTGFLWFLLTCHNFLPPQPPLLLLDLATSLHLIDGLLVLLSLIKLAFVCLSVGEQKEDDLTDVY